MPKIVDKEKRARDIRSGKTAAELSFIWKLTPSGVRVFAKNMGLEIAQDDREGRSSYDKELFADMAKSGKYTYLQLSYHFNETYEVVYDRVERMGLKKFMNSHVNESYVHSRYKDFKKHGRDFKTLGRLWNLNYKSTWGFCDRMGWLENDDEDRSEDD